MDFSEALRLIKDGYRLTRRGWNGRGQYVALHAADRSHQINLSYIYIRTVACDMVPWVASHTDMLAEDWVVDGD